MDVVKAHYERSGPQNGKNIEQDRSDGDDLALVSNNEGGKWLIWFPKTQPDNSSFSGCQIVVTRSKLPG